MIALLNIIVPVVVILLFWLAFKIKSFYPVIIALSFVVVYQLFQPSYMPKGVVKPLPNVEFQVNNSEIVDLELKPKSSEYYDSERNAALERIDQSINMQIEMNKQIQKNKE
jgi:hypothetical protein